MSYLLRFIQEYQPSESRSFLELEAQFQDLERATPNLPRGKRYQPLAGIEPTNTLIWECECASLAEVQLVLSSLESEPGHMALFEQQSPYIQRSRTEIYKVLEL